MLILSRKLGESIVIDGRITVKIMRVDGDHVKLGIEAPAEVPVHRQEVYAEIQKSNQEATTNTRTSLPRLTVSEPPPSISTSDSNSADSSASPASILFEVTMPATKD